MFCGLGFSPKSNQYKVIITFIRWTIVDPISQSRKYEDSCCCEILTLGTGTWISISSALYKTPYELERHCYEFSPACIDGKLFWLWSGNDYTNCIVSFDLDNEQFDFHSIPSSPLHDKRYDFSQPNWSMIILKGRLSVVHASHSLIWIRKKIWCLGIIGKVILHYWRLSFSSMSVSSILSTF